MAGVRWSTTRVARLGIRFSVGWVTSPFGGHRPQPQQQVAVDHHDAALQQVGGQVVVRIVGRRRRVHGDLEAEQLGVEGLGPLDVGDGEPEVVDRAEGERDCHRSTSCCRDRIDDPG
jgi:hypothetical protein